MMLRNRNQNVAARVEPPAKRNVSKQIAEKPTSGEPKPKRAALSELRIQLDNGLVIGSEKKGKNEKKEKRVSVHEQENVDDSVVVIDAPEGDVDPCPGYDFDAENKADQFNVPEYAMDIFKYYKSREGVFPVAEYMGKYGWDRDARALLVDWMIELQETFELNHESLYLAVKLVDLFLSQGNVEIERKKLQVVACAAIFIATKYDERQPPLIDDFLYVADDGFTRADLEQMERAMLNTVGFDLGCPLSYRFLRRYAKASKASMQVLTLARYVLETSLMFYEFCRSSESKMAAGAFLLALRMTDQKAEWSAVLHKYSGYSGEEVEPWCWAINHMLHVRASSTGVNQRLKNAFNKYSHEVFFKSSHVALLADRSPSTSPVAAP